MKLCPGCELRKPLDDFCRNKNEPTGRATYCKPCHNARTRETRQRLYGGGREYQLRRRYGIGQSHVEEMLGWQHNECAGCGKPDPEHVDHDHATSEVRGMLCFNCNQALGNVRDDAEVLLALHRYLALSRSSLPLRDRLTLMGIERRMTVVEPPAALVIEIAPFPHVTA